MQGEKIKLVPVAEVWEWQNDAACAGRGSDEFYGPSGERKASRVIREAAAQEVCGRCAVIEACGAFALETKQQYGVWGGMTEADRDALQGRSRRKPVPEAQGVANL